MKDLINAIIASRLPKKLEIDNQLMKIESFESTIIKLQNLQKSLGNYSQEHIDFYATINQKIEELKSKLIRLSERFGRDHIAITAFGATQAGKSVFWRSLTGITDSGIIPVGGEGVDESCTMTLVSYENIDANEIESAIVNYYSQEEFVGNINEQLARGNINANITTIAEIPNLRHQVEVSISNANANNTNLARHLERLLLFITNYGQYSSELHTNSRSVPIDIENVYLYVVRHINNVENYKYYPVKDVVIKKRINSDYGKIKFIDTRGVGEQAFGIETALKKTLKFESDGGLFIRKYSAGGGGAATSSLQSEICDYIKQIKGGELPWVQFIANADADFIITDQSSKRVINKFYDDDLHRSKEPCALFNIDSDLINCSNAESVKKLVERFVGYLSRNINDIDKKLEDDLSDSYAGINKLIATLQEVKQPDADSTSKENIKKKRIEELCSKIATLASEYEKKRRDNDADFEKAYKLDPNSDPERTYPNLSKLFDAKALALGNSEAYKYCTDKLRLAFVDKYVAGTTFKDSTNKLKRDIVTALVSNGIQLELETLSNGHQRIANIDKLGLGGAIGKLLHSLSDFTIDINSSFLYLIRYSVATIDINRNQPKENKLLTLYNGLLLPHYAMPSSINNNPSNSIPVGTNTGLNLKNAFGNNPATTAISTVTTTLNNDDNSNISYQTLLDNFKSCINVFNDLFKEEYSKSNSILFGFTNDFLDRLRNCEDCNDSLKNFFEANFDEIFKGTPEFEKIQKAAIERDIYKMIMSLNLLQ